MKQSDLDPLRAAIFLTEADLPKYQDKKAAKACAKALGRMKEAYSQMAKHAQAGSPAPPVSEAVLLEMFSGLIDTPPR